MVWHVVTFVLFQHRRTLIYKLSEYANFLTHITKSQFPQRSKKYQLNSKNVFMTWRTIIRKNLKREISSINISKFETGA